MDLIISIISLILSLGIYIGKAIENYKNVWFRFNKFSIKQNVVNTYCETLNLVIIPFMVINKSKMTKKLTKFMLNKIVKYSKCMLQIAQKKDHLKYGLFYFLCN